MYVCMYVCMYVYIYIYMAYIDVCIHICASIFRYSCTYLHTSITRTHIQRYVIKLYPSLNVSGAPVNFL